MILNLGHPQSVMPDPDLLAYMFRVSRDSEKGQLWLAIAACNTGGP